MHGDMSSWLALYGWSWVLVCVRVFVAYGCIRTYGLWVDHKYAYVYVYVQGSETYLRAITNSSQLVKTYKNGWAT